MTAMHPLSFQKLQIKHKKANLIMSSIVVVQNVIYLNAFPLISLASMIHFHLYSVYLYYYMIHLQSTPDNSNLQGKLKKVRLIGR